MNAIKQELMLVFLAQGLVLDELRLLQDPSLQDPAASYLGRLQDIEEMALRPV